MNNHADKDVLVNYDKISDSVLHMTRIQWDM